MKPFLRTQLERFARRLQELDFLLSREDIMADMVQYRAISKEHAEVTQIAGRYARYLQREAEGLDRIPYPGELGQRIYENISAEAWRAWVGHQTMLINEYRLSPIEPKARKFLAEEDQMPPCSLISKHFGWTSLNAAQEHTAALVRKGLLEHNVCGKLRFPRPAAGEGTQP